MADEAFAGETAVRRRLRWHEVANTLVILVFALGIVALAAFFVLRSDAWNRHRRPAPGPAPIVVAPVPAKPVAASKTPVEVKPPAVAIPRTVAKPPPVISPPKEIAARPKPAAADGARAPPAPQIRIEPLPPTVAMEEPAEPAAMDRPSGPAAKQMLNSIKCFDAFEFDFRARGRQYFSALCKGGNRKQVSCAGAGCKIEYAPAPSHAPTGG